MSRGRRPLPRGIILEERTSFNYKLETKRFFGAVVKMNTITYCLYREIDERKSPSLPSKKLPYENTFSPMYQFLHFCIYFSTFLYILLWKIFFILSWPNCISLRLKMQQRIFHIRMYVVSKRRSSPGGCGGQPCVSIASPADISLCKNLDFASFTAHNGVIFYPKSGYYTQCI